MRSQSLPPLPVSGSGKFLSFISYLLWRSHAPRNFEISALTSFADPLLPDVLKSQCFVLFWRLWRSLASVTFEISVLISSAGPVHEEFLESRFSPPSWRSPAPGFPMSHPFNSFAGPRLWDILNTYRLTYSGGSLLQESSKSHALPLLAASWPSIC